MHCFPRYDLDSGIVLTHRETNLELFFYLLRLKEQHFRSTSDLVLHLEKPMTGDGSSTPDIFREVMSWYITLA